MAAADNFFRALQRLMNVNESVCICSWPFSVNNFRKKGKKVEIPNLYKKKVTNVFSLHDYRVFFIIQKKSCAYYRLSVLKVGFQVQIKCGSRKYGQ